MIRDLSTFQIERVSEAAHEVNRVWQRIAGDPQDAHWDALSEQDKQAARTSVIGIVVHDFNAEQTHAAWVADKKSKGWSVGPTKDAATKEHPCLVAWEQLPSEQRVKDELWVDTVRNFLKNLWRLPQ